MTHQPSFLRDRAYLAVSLTHFCVDVLNSGRTLLMALLAVSMGLSNAQVGIALLLYNVGSALSQPYFGLLADRHGPRWLVVGGMAWMIFFYGLAAAAGDWLALAAVTVAGLGSGAFHPPGALVASQASQTWRTQATAVFFTAGQLGLFVGPIMAGAALAGLGRPGYALLCLFALAALAAGWRWVANPERLGSPTGGMEHGLSEPGVALIDPTDVPSSVAASGREEPARPSPRVIAPLVVLIVTISTVGIAAINFGPKLFTEMGYRPDYVGLMAGLFMLGSAFGGLTGGALADRFGGRPAILLGVLCAVLPLYYYIPAPGLTRFGLLALSGFFAGMPHSVLVLMAQGLLPGRRALASGLTLGFMFFSGAVGSYLLGVIADRVGLGPALQGTAALLLIAAVAALALPGKASGRAGANGR